MLTDMQCAFASCKEFAPAFIGGYGSGKTTAAIARALAFKFQFPACDIAYYLPTYPLVEDIAFRRFPDICERHKWQYRLNKASAFLEIVGCGRIVFRTMENPHRIIGYEVAHSILDELDTLPMDKAREVWNRVIARNRQKCGIANTVAVATTPEGFRFVYERWAKSPAPGHIMFRAKTSDNAANLPDGYIDNLRNTYPTNLLAAYLDGEFVNLTAGSVYPEFDRDLNASRETIQPGEPLHIGMDFNVEHMAAVVFVLRDGNPHAVGEVTGVFDTPAMIRVLQGKYQGHAIYIYPDASGKNRKSVNASESDLALLRQARFTVLVNSRNPAVKDRVLSTNRMIHADGVRRLFVNIDTSPGFVEALEKQAYDKNGEPDKTSGLDHVIDAGTYFVAYKFPVVHARTTVSPVSIR